MTPDPVPAEAVAGARHLLEAAPLLVLMALAGGVAFTRTSMALIVALITIGIYAAVAYQRAPSIASLFGASALLVSVALFGHLAASARRMSAAAREGAPDR